MPAGGGDGIGLTSEQNNEDSSASAGGCSAGHWAGGSWASATAPVSSLCWWVPPPLLSSIRTAVRFSVIRSAPRSGLQRALDRP